MKLTEQELLKFEKDYFENKYPNLRYGQAICNLFEVSKEIEDKIYYANITLARMYIWELFGQ